MAPNLAMIRSSGPSFLHRFPLGDAMILFAFFVLLRLPWSRAVTGTFFQSDTDLFIATFGEVNTGLFKSSLYFEDGREISFHNTLILFNAPNGCRADSCLTGKPVLAPA